MDSLKDLNLVKTIRQEANDLLEKDLELKRLPLLSQKLLRFKQSIHLE